VFEDISSGDVSLVWEFVEETGDDFFGSYGNYIDRQGPAALQVEATGDPIFVSDEIVSYLFVYEASTGFVYGE
jgi:hypothetical protein